MSAERHVLGLLAPCSSVTKKISARKLLPPGSHWGEAFAGGIRPQLRISTPLLSFLASRHTHNYSGWAELWFHQLFCLQYKAYNQHLPLLTFPVSLLLLLPLSQVFLHWKGEINPNNSSQIRTTCHHQERMGIRQEKEELNYKEHLHTYGLELCAPGHAGQLCPVLQQFQGEQPPHCLLSATEMFRAL